MSDRITRRSWRPVSATAAAALFAVVMLVADRLVALGWDDQISGDAARTFLATVAGTMITATVVVFWIRGLLVSTRSGNFPNRILSTYLDEPGQQWLMGATVGVFVFASIVLFDVPVRSTDAAPTMSIMTTGLATVIALIAIIYSISSGADAMHEQRILRRIVDATLEAIDRQYPDGQTAGTGPPDTPDEPPAGVRTIVRSTRLGWLRTVDAERLLNALPDAATCHRNLPVGNFVSPGDRLCTVWADDPDPDLAERVEAAFGLGVTRAPTEDISFGLRNLVDIALAGTTDGADRTNTREAIEHLEAVLRPLVVRDGPPRVHRDDRGRRLIRSDDDDCMVYLADALEDLYDAVRDARTRRLLDATVDNLIDAAETAGRSDRARAIESMCSTMGTSVA